MNKLNLVMLMMTVWALAIYGCSTQSETEQSSEESTEFFKEIDNMAIQENAEIEAEQLENIDEPVILTEAAAPMIETGVIIPDKPTLHDIQQALKNANLYSGKIDGVLGPKTKKSIEDFQQQNSLKVDGKVGPLTWEKLKVYYHTASVETQSDSAAGEVQTYDAKTIQDY